MEETASKMPSPSKSLPPLSEAAPKSVIELEKKITKLRNANQSLSQEVHKATKLLEREIGECVDIDQLYKEDGGWKGRA